MRRTKKRAFFRLPSTVCRLPALFILATASALAQTQGAQLLRQQKPVYPEKLTRAVRQGNVLLVGRIDKSGRVQDIKAVGSTLPDFVDPAVAAVKAWQFRPALANGKPVEIAANIGLRFRLEGNVRGQLSSPMLGDLAIFPADRAGNRTAPEGFPIRNGGDPGLRVEPVLDLSPSSKASTIRVRAEAVSPAGRRVVILDRAVPVDAKMAQVAFPFSAKVGPDWQGGVWMIRFTADGADVGRGQFWLARDPARFDFAAALRKLTP